MTQLTCQEMEECTSFVGRRLREVELTDYWSGENRGVAGVVNACAPCRAASSQVRPKKCQGWRLDFWGNAALRLAPTDVDGRLVNAVLEGGLVVGPLSGQIREIERVNFAISVKDPLQDKLLTRQHCDRANPNQPGSVWHMQLGGLPSIRSQRPEYEWLDLPRWPSLPIDFMLAVEVLTYNFQWETWCDLRQDSGWQGWVKESEDLVLAPYRDELNQYWATRGSHTSWLSVQCNRLET